MLLAMGIRTMENVDALLYLNVVTYSGTLWVRHLPKLAVCCGIVAIFLGIFRFSVITLMSKDTALFVSIYFSSFTCNVHVCLNMIYM